MSETRLDFQGFHWLDVLNPTPERLQQLAETYNLHPTSVQDCLQPEHLPKYELIEDVSFVVLRAYDPEAAADADSVQELTRKVALFFSQNFVISIHRKEQGLVREVMERWSKKTQNALSPEHILADLMNAVLRSYERPVMACLSDLELFETEIFGAGTSRKFRLSKGYYLKRKTSVFKRMLRATTEPVNRTMAGADIDLSPQFQDAKDVIENLSFYSDEVLDNMNSLLNLFVSLASQRTNEASHKINEVMRVLTIFSCFFLPINFIASIYGMNFANLPETRWEYGYFYALGLMAAVSLTIFLWFRRRGWLIDSNKRVKNSATL